jgi:hypothetical protein
MYIYTYIRQGSKSYAIISIYIYIYIYIYIFIHIDVYIYIYVYVYHVSLGLLVNVCGKVGAFALPFPTQNNNLKSFYKLSVHTH